MVLLYLTSQQNADALDGECAAKGILIKKMTGHFNLNHFVVQDGSNLGAFSYLAIDLQAIRDGEDEIVQALAGFSAMHSAQVIVVAHGMAENDPFLVRLRDEGIRCVVNNAEVVPEQAPPMAEPEFLPVMEPVQEPPPQIEPLLEPEPIPEAICEPAPNYDPEPVPQPILSPIRQPISIGICGAIHRIGVTTQALNMAAYLSQQDYKVCVVEANAHGHFGQIAQFYGLEMDLENGCIHHADIGLFLHYDLSTINRFGYTATIFDYGMFEEMDMHSFFTRDVKIICAGAKAWESSALGEVFAACGGRNDLHFLFSFTPQEEQRDVRELMGKYAGNTHFSEYIPTLFEPMPNEDIYTAILMPYLQPAATQTNEPPRKGLFSLGACQ